MVICLYLILLNTIKINGYFTLPLETVKIIDQYDLYLHARNITFQERVEEQVNNFTTFVENVSDQQDYNTTEEVQHDPNFLKQVDRDYQFNYSNESNEFEQINQSIIEDQTTIQLEIQSSSNVDPIPIVIETPIQRADIPRNQSIVLDNYYNYQYIGSINVYDQNKITRQLKSLSKIYSYKVIFDTGSSWLWLPSHQCQGCPLRYNKGVHCTDNITQCQTKDQVINITYSVGAITGMLAEGYFGFTQNLNEFNRTPFLLVNKAWGMEGALYEGIVGLELNNYEDDLVQWPVGFYLSYGDDSQTKEKSQINFGGVNEQLLDQNAVMLQVPVNDHWILDVSALEMEFSVQGGIKKRQLFSKNLQEVSTNQNEGFKAVIDSGSSLLILPNSLLTQFYELLSQNQKVCQEHEITHTSLKCSCPTQDKSSFPTLLIRFQNGVQVTLEPQYYVHSNPNSHICHLLISPIPSHDNNLIILGNPFMRKYYTLFDRKEKQVGLAQSINTLQKQEFLNLKSMISYVTLLAAILFMSMAIITIVNTLTIHSKVQEKVGQSDSVNYRLV